MKVKAMTDKQAELRKSFEVETGEPALIWLAGTMRKVENPKYIEWLSSQLIAARERIEKLGEDNFRLANDDPFRPG